jgi:hypothetical protein
MNADAIVQTRAKELFSEYLRPILDRKHWSKSDFQRALYGADGKGKPRGAGNLYPVLNGSNRLSDGMLEKWASVLAVPAAELEALREKAGVTRNTAYVPVAKVPAKVLALKAPKPETPLSPARMAAALSIPDLPKAGPPQFSLVVDQQGMATLRLNLVDIPMGKAMQAMQALMGAGLISGVPPE